MLICKRPFNKQKLKTAPSQKQDDSRKNVSPFQKGEWKKEKNPAILSYIRNITLTETIALFLFLST